MALCGSLLVAAALTLWNCFETPIAWFTFQKFIHEGCKRWCDYSEISLSTRPQKGKPISWWTPWSFDLNALSTKGLLRNILLFSDFGNLSTMIKGIDIEGDQMNGHKWKWMEIQEMHAHEMTWKERNLKAGQAICKVVVGPKMLDRFIATPFVSLF